MPNQFQTEADCVSFHHSKMLRGNQSLFGIRLAQSIQWTFKNACKHTPTYTPTYKCTHTQIHTNAGNNGMNQQRGIWSAHVYTQCADQHGPLLPYIQLLLLLYYHLTISIGRKRRARIASTSAADSSVYLSEPLTPRITNRSQINQSVVYTEGNRPSIWERTRLFFCTLSLDKDVQVLQMASKR